MATEPTHPASSAASSAAASQTNRSRGKELLGLTRGLIFLAGALVGLCLGWYLFSPKPYEPGEEIIAKLQEIKPELREKLRSHQPLNLVVVGILTEDGARTVFGDELRASLRSILDDLDPQISLVEREKVGLILEEQQLQATPFVSRQSAAGPLSGADAVVDGTLFPSRQRVVLQIEIFDVGTSEVLASETVNFAANRDIALALADEISAPKDESYSGLEVRKEAHEIAEPYQFHIRLEACELSLTTVICDLQVINRRDDKRDFYAYGTSWTEVAGRRLDDLRFSVEGGEYLNWIKVPIRPKETIQLQVEFLDVPEDAQSLDQLTLASKPFRVHFQDVPLRQAGPPVELPEPPP